MGRNGRCYQTAGFKSQRSRFDLSGVQGADRFYFCCVVDLAPYRSMMLPYLTGWIKAKTGSFVVDVLILAALSFIGGIQDLTPRRSNAGYLAKR